MTRDYLNQKTKSSTFSSSPNLMQTRGFDSNVANTPTIQRKSEVDQNQSERKSSDLDLSKISVFAPGTPTPPPIQAQGINGDQQFEMNENNNNRGFMFNPVNQTTPNVQLEHNSSSKIVQRDWDDVKATAKNYLIPKANSEKFLGEDTGSNSARNENRQNMSTGKKIAQIAGRSAGFLPNTIYGTLKSSTLGLLGYGNRKLFNEEINMGKVISHEQYRQNAVHNAKESLKTEKAKESEIKETENIIKTKKSELEEIKKTIASKEVEMKDTTEDTKKQVTLKEEIKKLENKIEQHQGNIDSATKMIKNQKMTNIIKKSWNPGNYDFYGDHKRPS